MRPIEVLGLVAAVLGVGTIIYLNRREKTLPGASISGVSVDEVVSAVQTEESAKYSNALLRDYEIVIPTAVASKKVRMKAERVSSDRHRINPRKVKKPLTINEL